MSKIKQSIVAFWKDENGLGTLEILLIIAVLVLIAVAFRKWIIAWVNSLFDTTQGELDKPSLLPKEPPGQSPKP